MTTTTQKIVKVYPLLDKAKYSRMEIADRQALIKAMFSMRKIAEDFSDFRAEAMKMLTPDNAEELSKTLRDFNSHTPQERIELMSVPRYAEALEANAEFERAVTETLREESEREIRLEFTPLTQDAFDRLLDSNPDWTLGEAIMIQDILCD